MAGEHPQRIGRYEVSGLIGSGGQASVYRARDPQLGRDVALKMLHYRGAPDEGILERFKREGRILGELDDRGLCKVFDTGVDHGQQFIVMELVEGISLAALLDQRCAAWDTPSQVVPSAERAVVATARPASAARVALTRAAMLGAVRIVAAIARSLAVAHAKGVWHRDIKPGNIMLRKDGTPVVLDFGLARDTGDSALVGSQTGDRMGTPAYMSPEQVHRKRAQVDQRTDVWSLGVVLYEMLSLRRPFEGASVVDLEHAILNVQPPDLSRTAQSIPGDLVAVVEKALEKDVARRYATMSDFADELQRVAEGKPVIARRIGPAGRLVRWVQREPVVAGSLGAVILALGIGLASSLHSLGLAETATADAQHNFGLAETARADAQRHLEEWQLLADGRELEELFRQAKDDLLPVHEALVPRMEAWLVRARRIASRVALFRETRAVLRTRLRPLDEAALAAERAQFERTLSASLRELDGVEARLKNQEAEALAELPVTEALRDALESVAAEYGDHLPQRRRQLVQRLSDFSERLTLFPAEYEDFRKKREQWVADLAWVRAQKPWNPADPRLDDIVRTTRLRRTFQFGDDWATRVQHDAVQKLARDAEALTAPMGTDSSIEQTSIVIMEERLVLAQSLAERSLVAAAEAWRRAAARVATNAVYRGLVLAPQSGLVPLGADPQTGFEEFADLQTGTAPVRGTNGALAVENGSAMVFVLLPGGEFVMGAQASDPAATHHDPESTPVEGPPHRVRLSPFLMGKHEVTQGQWERARARNPSMIKVRHVGGGRVSTPRNPVDNVSWTESVEFLRQLGALLPTEAQWEYACRAGTTTPWPGVKSQEELRFLANLGDICLRERCGDPTFPCMPWNDDEYAPSPIGTFAPNAFGLYDLCGNMQEWCLDIYGETTYADQLDAARAVPGAPADPILEDPVLREGPFRYVMRGGNWQEGSGYARSSSRGAELPTSKQYLYGLRAARGLAPAAK